MPAQPVRWSSIYFSIVSSAIFADWLIPNRMWPGCSHRHAVTVFSCLPVRSIFTFFKITLQSIVLITVTMLHNVDFIQFFLSLVWMEFYKL